MRSATLRNDLLAGLAVLTLLALLPLLFSSPRLQDFGIRLAAFGIFATSLNILIGFGGMASFGHGLFFGAGAYAFGLLMQKTGASIPLAIVGSVLFSALLALLVGAICVRLKEIYFTFLTLAFQMLFHSVIISWTSLTGGDQGLMGGIPRPPVLGVNLANTTHLYWFSCVVAVLCLLAMRHLLETPFGYTLRMVRDNPERAEFLGIRVWRIRLAAFVIAGGFAGVGGMLMALFVSGAYPEFAYWTISGEAVFMIMMGGMHVFLGPVVGAALLLQLNDVITKFTEYHGLALGIVVLLFALVFRRGVTDFLGQIWRRLFLERSP
ncbi:MAG: branched-chain amino acid ABC transporter permease [Burkholderiaceae bacterium]|nr:branched-chain amino acid ABC transporter permease [Burkholderiaceae bacterium]